MTTSIDLELKWYLGDSWLNKKTAGLVNSSYRLLWVFHWQYSLYRNITVAYLNFCVCLNLFFMLPKWHKCLSAILSSLCCAFATVNGPTTEFKIWQGQKLHLSLTNSNFTSHLPSACTFSMSCLLSDMKIH